MKVVEVAVGVILKGNDIFITRRDEHLHQGGKWEFPGGKKESHETMEQAMVRELEEEVGIQVRQQQPLMIIEHDYGDKRVLLDVRLITEFSSDPYGKEGQEGRWVAINELDEYSFPEANQAIIKKLQAID